MKEGLNAVTVLALTCTANRFYQYCTNMANRFSTVQILLYICVVILMVFALVG